MLLTGLVPRSVVLERNVMLLPQVAVYVTALVSHGKVADLAAVHVADGQLQMEMEFKFSINVVESQPRLGTHERKRKWKAINSKHTSDSALFWPVLESQGQFLK